MFATLLVLLGFLFGAVEEDSPLWDCRTDGNQICGDGAILPNGEKAIPGRYAYYAVEDCQDITYHSNGKRADILPNLPICI